jgi:hypothetical protein
MLFFLSLVFVFTACQKNADDTGAENEKAPVQEAVSAASGLDNEELKALEAEEEVNVEETIDEDNARSELDKLKAEIDADK